jgi:hypothetical protein
MDRHEIMSCKTKYANSYLKIQRALSLFYGSARYAMGIYHRSPYIAVAKERLNCPYVVIGLQKMGRKTVAEGMGGDALREFGATDCLVKRLLNVRFMKMIPSKLLCARNRRQRLLRKEPLPDEILRG